MNKLLISIFFLLATFAASLYQHTLVSAVSPSDWHAGNIINDPLFFNGDAMSLQDIQNFLNAQVPTCDTWGNKLHSSGVTRAQYGTSVGVPPPYICVKDYYENPETHETNFNPSATIPAGAKSAAQIIYEASIRYNVSPKVILVTIKKEAAENLLGDDWPWPSQYRSALGYGCPDTAPCDAEYYGFYNQVENATRQFRRYATYPEDYRYRVGQINFIQYNPNSACSGTNVYIESQATAGLYNYTPYQPNAAALANMYGEGDGCSAYGNRNFWRIWNDWFGSTSGPAAFTVPGSNKIYIPVNQYKLAVPYAAAMQDYGISWESIRNVSQAYVDSIPSPPTTSGVSSSISHVIKSTSDSDADGGSIYLVSLGKRYKFQSMEQFLAFGFLENDISYIPIEYILNKQDGGLLSNYFTSPYGSVFELNITTKLKRIIFEYSTYARLNPTDRVAALSYYLVDKIPSGTPLTDRSVLIKYVSGESPLYYYQDQYALVPTYDIYQCSGFETTNKTPVYRLPQNDYVASVASTQNLSCVSKIDNVVYMLNDGYKSEVSDAIGLVADPVSILGNQIMNSVPNAQHQLSPYVKVKGNAAVWYLSAGKRRVIPTYNTFQMIGLSDVNLDYIHQTNLDLFVNDGFKLARTQIVKDSSSAVVYIVDDSNRYTFQTSDLFLAYKYSWSKIDNLDGATLNKNYPVSGNVSPIIANKTSHNAYAVATNGCFNLSVTDLSALGKTQSSLESSIAYESTLFKNLNFTQCKAGSQFIKQPNQSLVYWLNDGVKHPILTYSALLMKNGGMEPTIMTLDLYFIDSLPVGSSVY